MPPFDLSTLYRRIEARAKAGEKSSYSLQLLEQGRARIAQKFGEEAVETLIAALHSNEHERGALCEESADLLYHLCLLWYSCGVAPRDVYAVLQQRAQPKIPQSED